MSQHNSLRERWEQHAIKNNLSKYDDANAKKASEEVVKILNDMFPNHIFELKTKLMFNQIEKYCGRSFNIDYDYSRRSLQPDGGVIWMDDTYPILISEMKRQGTNDERVAEGKKKQAVGNAIERLGKNLKGFECLYENDDIMPFICFCWGCDVVDGTFLGKLYTLNSFNELNIIYDTPTKARNRPFSCLLKEDAPFNLEEMVFAMLQIATSAIYYFENKGE